jgi:tetratricopeptide (TPR) repeat protein
MKINPKHKKPLIYLIPMGVAALARIIFFFQWVDSPFRYYHTLYGLDMRTLLAWGETFYSKKLPFFMYKFFINCIYLIAGKENLPVAIVVVQMILGVLISGLTVYVFLHFFRNRIFAMVSGLCTALYAPFLVYETQILKETLFLFLCFLGLASVLTLRRKKFSFLYSFSTGVIITAPFFLRFSGLLFGLFMLFWIFLYLMKNPRGLLDLLLNREWFKVLKQFKPLIPVILGVFTLFGLISLYNLSNNRSNSIYFNPNSSYLLGVGKQSDIRSLSFHDNKKAELDLGNNRGNYAFHYFKKFGYIFSGYEQPNNVNYYFIRKKMFFLKILPGPMIFIPLGVSGLILLIINFRKNSRISLLLFYMLSAIIPMILFVPLARYKILLAPVFVVFAAYYLFYIFSRIHNNNRKSLLRPLLILLTALIFSVYFCREIPERHSDVQAYGLAASYIPDQLMKQGKFKEARKILEAYYSKNKENPYIMLNYVSSLLGTGNPKEAYFTLTKPITIKEPALKGRYYYEMGECSYILGKKDDALIYYCSATQYPISTKRLELTNNKIQKIRKGKDD